MYPIAAGIVVENKDLYGELTHSLQDLAVRVLFELPEVPEDWPGFLDRIERVRPDVVILDVTRLRQPLEEVVSRIRGTSGQPAVFAMHPTADPAAILAALRAGAAEFLNPPFAAPLKSALERLGASRQNARESRKSASKTVGFVSAKGGCGATTLACHVAVALASHANAKVLLADFDMQAGLIGFLVKAKSPYSVADAANNLQRLDPSYWHALVSNGIPGLEVISAPDTPNAKQIPAQQLKQVLGFARAQYDWTVLDLGRNLTAATLSILDLVAETYLVTTPEIPALHEAKTMIQSLLDSGYPKDSLRLVINRMHRRGDVTPEELGDMLGLRVFETIPNDYQVLHEAYAEGRMVEAGTTLGRCFTRLAAKIAGVPTQRKRFSLFG